MKFSYPKNVYDEPVKPIKLHPELNYKLAIDEFGNEVVVSDGERDIQAEIDSFADECSIYKILERHEAGDLTALNSNQGSYITKEMAEAANDFVNGLTVDQSLYNSYQKFGTDKISFDEYKNYVKNGDYQKLLDIASGKVEAAASEVK